MSENFSSPHKEFQRSPHKQRVTGAQPDAGCNRTVVHSVFPTVGWGLFPTWMTFDRTMPYNDADKTAGDLADLSALISKSGFPQRFLSSWGAKQPQRWQTASDMGAAFPGHYNGFETFYRRGLAAVATERQKYGDFVQIVNPDGTITDPHWYWRVKDASITVQTTHGFIKSFSYSDGFGDTYTWQIDETDGTISESGTLASELAAWRTGVSNPDSPYFGKGWDWYSIEGFAIKEYSQGRTAFPETDPTERFYVNSDGTSRSWELNHGEYLDDGDNDHVSPGTFVFSLTLSNYNYGFVAQEANATVAMGAVNLATMHGDEIYDIDGAYIGTRIRAGGLFNVCSSYWSFAIARYTIGAGMDYIGGDIAFGDCGTYPERPIVISVFPQMEEHNTAAQSVFRQFSSDVFSDTFYLSQIKFRNRNDSAAKSYEISELEEYAYDTSGGGGTLTGITDCVHNYLTIGDNIVRGEDMIFAHGRMDIYQKQYMFANGNRKCEILDDAYWDSVKPC